MVNDFSRRDFLRTTALAVGAAAVSAARRVAEVMKSAGATPLYADGNSIKLRSSQRVGEIISGNS